MNRKSGFVTCVLLAVAATLPQIVNAHGPNGHGNAAHGDHEPHHGGFVVMYQELHFEVVMPAAGGVQIHYTDAARTELPAAVVSDVAVEIERKGLKTETVPMAISAGGDFWVGKTQPSTVPAIIRIAFMLNGKAALFNVSSANLPKASPTPAKGAPKTATTPGHAEHHG